MAIRKTTHVLKNSDIVNRPLPSSLLKGEPIVNTADGVVYFSGITTSTAEWTPAGTGSTASFFEVGSNLYDLRLRNQITKYQGQSGASLAGKFLSGTTSGFVLADIADIAASTDSYTTGATWSPNTLTINLNNGKPSVPVTIDTFNGVTFYGTNTVNGNLTVTGTTTLNGPAYYNNTASASNEIVNYGLLTAFSQTNDVYVTGSTLTVANNDTPTQSADLLYHGIPVGGPYSIVTENTFTTGGTWNSGTTAIDFTRNDGVIYSVSLSNIDVNDTYVTGGTVTSLGDLELFRNDGATVTVPKVTYWTSGSTGSFAIKAINSTALDAKGDRAVAWGNETLASGNDSTAWGIRTSATTIGTTASGYLTLASGSYSNAEGVQTTASGNYSHAEGQGVTASGQGSHAEGGSTIASGTYSHAEGQQTTASASASHAEGLQTTASGNYSHSEGANTTASGYGSHSEGYQTTASNYYSHAEGKLTTASGDYSHSEGYGTLTLGLGSHAEGDVTTASGLASHSEGRQTLASGNHSHAEGWLASATTIYAHAEGVSTIASGVGSHAEGLQTTASGIYSHSEGQNTLAGGQSSHAEGSQTTASGNYAHAEGLSTTSSGPYSHTEGSQTTASGNYSHSEGGLTTSSGYYSHAEGNGTLASGNSSHAEGSSTTASGTYSHAEGISTTASGYGSHAEGESTTSSGVGSHAEGWQTIASGLYSHAEGRETTALGNYSHTQGSGTTASGVASFASGVVSIAQSDYSFIHSQNSIVSGQRSVVLGGQNITGSTNDTVYVPYLNLNYVPTLNNSNTEILSRNSSTGQVEYTALSAFTTLDTYVTGFTYNPASNTFTISQNQGQPDLTASIGSVSGLTVSNLTAGRVVYVGTGGLLTDEAGFEYNDGTNLLTVGNINVQNASGTTANIGQGGLVIGSGGSFTNPGAGDLTVHGNLTVFGTETIVATTELYVEDPQVTLNYNPTGDTSSTSVSSGIRIQDGNGTSTGDTYFTIGQMQNLTGIVVGENPDVTEYTGLTGYANRGWITQLNDIVIRNNNLNEGSPNGVRVLAEFDILDGGTF